MDMLNFLVSNGWDYVETQAGFTDDGEQTPIFVSHKKGVKVNDPLAPPPGVRGALWGVGFLIFYFFSFSCT
jgi:hypothetical protein